MRWKRFFWPAVGLTAVALAIRLLIRELRGISLDEVWTGLEAIPAQHWMLAAGSAVFSYVALAGYDRIALLHLRKPVRWWFVMLCSFTTYALSHNIGGSVFSGAMIRYRAYGTRGLSGREIGVLVGICSITFVLSTLLVSGVVLLIEPDIPERFSNIGYDLLSTSAGIFMLMLVAAYVLGSCLRLRPLKIGNFQLEYPRWSIVARQLTIGPAELVGAGSIFYFALPSENPGFLIVLGVFLVAFSLAQLSHAPGGLGVFEVLCLTGLSEMDEVGVLAALLVFRMFYLIIPLLIALVVVVLFERSQLRPEPNRPAP